MQYTVTGYEIKSSKIRYVSSVTKAIEKTYSPYFCSIKFCDNKIVNITLEMFYEDSIEKEHEEMYCIDIFNSSLGFIIYDVYQDDEMIDERKLSEKRVRKKFEREMDYLDFLTVHDVLMDFFENYDEEKLFFYKENIEKISEELYIEYYLAKERNNKIKNIDKFRNVYALKNNYKRKMK